MEELFKCNKCNYYASINELSVKKHSQKCNGGFKGFTCPLCFKTFMNKPLLQKHNASAHSIKNIRYCQYCNEDFNYTEVNHYRHEEKCFNNPKNSITYNCLYCRRKYITLEEREGHLLNCKFKPIENISDYIFNKINENNTNNVGIYKIVSPNDSLYIGMTNDSFAHRWEQHLKLLKSGKHHCSGLQRSFNKYGWAKLQKIIIEEYAPIKESKESIILNNFLLIREIQAWDGHKEKKINIYNGRPTGTGSTKHTEESKEKTRFTQYFNSQSSCKIYINNCSECTKLFTSKKQRKTCSDKCFSLLKAKQTIIRHFNNEKIKVNKYKLCHYSKCCNYLSGKKFYCSDNCKTMNNNDKGYFVSIPKDILEEYYLEKLYSTTEIAKIFNSNHMNVQKLLKDNGVPIRSRIEGLHAKQVRWVRENIDEKNFISNYYKYDLQKLSKIYGTSVTNIERAIVEYIIR